MQSVFNSPVPANSLRSLLRRQYSCAKIQADFLPRRPALGPRIEDIRFARHFNQCLAKAPGRFVFKAVRRKRPDFRYPGFDPVMLTDIRGAIRLKGGGFHRRFLKFRR